VEWHQHTHCNEIDATDHIPTQTESKITNQKHPQQTAKQDKEAKNNTKTKQQTRTRIIL
jgi:hypothetical protein